MIIYGVTIRYIVIRHLQPCYFLIILADRKKKLKLYAYKLPSWNAGDKGEFDPETGTHYGSNMQRKFVGNHGHFGGGHHGHGPLGHHGLDGLHGGHFGHHKIV